MRTNIERLGLRMAAEIEGKRRRARLTAKQECDGSGARSVALESFHDGTAQSGGAILLQQLQQMRGLIASRFALGKGEIEKRFALGDGLLQTTARRGVECLALDLEDRFLMSGIEHELVAIVGAYMASDLDGTVENTHAGIGCNQGQLASNRLRRDGVIVEIEANIDGLVGANGLDSIGGERMQRRRKQPRPLLLEDFGDSEVIAARPAPLVRNLISPEQSLTIAFGQRCEGAARPERIADIADGPLHTPFLIARAHLARPWSEVVVRAQLDESRVKQNLIAAAFEHGTFQVVVKDHSRLPGPEFKRVDVAAEEVLHGLIEEELQIQGARIR